MKRPLRVGLAVFTVVLLAAPAWAVVHNDQFTATIDPAGVVTGSGTGWNGGQFVYYPATGWYNQWFYNDPPSWERWKWITYDISVVPQVPDPQRIIEIAINWSTMGYPMNPNQPPLDDQWIVRDQVYVGPVLGPMCLRSLDLEPGGKIVIPDYNPEWVSIDIRQLEPGIEPLPITLVGCVTHECVPEPSTLALVVLGAMGLLLARRR